MFICLQFGKKNAGIFLFLWTLSFTFCHLVLVTCTIFLWLIVKSLISHWCYMFSNCLFIYLVFFYTSKSGGGGIWTLDVLARNTKRCQPVEVHGSWLHAQQLFICFHASILEMLCSKYLSHNLCLWFKWH